MASIVSRLTAWALRRRIVRAFLRYSSVRGPALADSVTYRTLFSLFAGVLLGFSIAAIALAGNPDALRAIVSSLDAAIPGLVDLIDLRAINAPGTFTIAGVVSVIGLVLAAIGAIGSLRTALRTIVGFVGDDTFPLWVILRNLVLAILLGAGLAAAAAVTFLATAGLSLVSGWLGISADEPWLDVLTWALSALVVFALDTVVVAASFFALAGVRPRAKTLWTGAMLGGAGLTVLQQLSGLFVGGAGSNPLLATFASFIALLLWLNLSSQVVLIAGSYIVTAMEEDEDRVRARHGATTMLQFRVQRAEHAVQAASDELSAARAAEENERTTALGAAS
jgi:membrane protein